MVVASDMERVDLRCSGERGDSFFPLCVDDEEEEEDDDDDEEGG